MKKIDKKIIIIIISLVIIAFIVYQFLMNKREYLENNDFLVLNNEISKKENEIKETTVKNVIVVHIAGEVNNSGVYELEENSRVSQAIEKAGGLTENADITNINLAHILEDGIKIYIPKKGEENESIEEQKVYENSNNSNNISSSKQNSKININTATKEELETLPGIGSATATKIIDYRKEKGKFLKIEDIKEVSGIGESKFDKIKDLIKV